LHRLQHLLVLPARDPPLRSCGAAALEWAAMASHGPVAPQRQPTLDIAVVVLELLAGRTAVGVFLGQVDEVLLAKAAVGLGTRGHRLGQGDSDTSSVTGQGLLTVPRATGR